MQESERQKWIKEAEEILAARPPSSDFAPSSELVQFATSMLSVLYGAESAQLKALQEGTRLSSPNLRNVAFVRSTVARGAIENTVRELKSGLIRNVRAEVEGEVLADLLALAKESLDSNSLSVAAVLAAAAFEDTIRRLGAERSSIMGRPKLEEVIGVLKQTTVLKGSQVGIALSYLKFRNSSLHADWKQVNDSDVRSCIAFVESLLLAYFS